MQGQFGETSEVQSTSIIVHQTNNDRSATQRYQFRRKQKKFVRAILAHMYRKPKESRAKFKNENLEISERTQLFHGKEALYYVHVA